MSRLKTSGESHATTPAGPLRIKRRPSLKVERLEDRTVQSSFAPYGPPLPMGGSAPGAVASGTFYDKRGVPRTFIVAGYDNSAGSNASFEGGISIYVQDGHGQFKNSMATPKLTLPKTDTGDGAQPEGVATGRFVGNGFDDIAVADNKDRVFILEGNGDGTFKAPRLLLVDIKPDPANYEATSLTSAKIDGVRSLIVSHYGFGVPGSLLIYQQDRLTHNLKLVKTLDNVDTPNQAVVADFNRDHHDDIAVSNDGINSVTIFQGKGHLHFKAFKPVSLSPPPTLIDPAFFGPKTYGLAAADLNGDGRVDLTVSINGGIRFLKNVSSTGHSISFQEPLNSKMDFLGQDIANVVAVNLGHRHPDLAITQTTTGRISVLRNHGNFRFDIAEPPIYTSPIRYTGTGPLALIVANLRLKGHPRGPSLLLTNTPDQSIDILARTP